MDYSLVPTTHVGVLKPPFTPALRKLISSPDFYGHCTHVPHTHIDTHAHKINEEVFLKDEKIGKHCSTYIFSLDGEV